MHPLLFFLMGFLLATGLWLLVWALAGRFPSVGDFCKTWICNAK